MRFIRFLAAAVLCGAALALPYRPRVLYLRAVAWAVHAPYLLFGMLARRLLSELGLREERSR